MATALKTASLGLLTRRLSSNSSDTDSLNLSDLARYGRGLSSTCLLRQINNIRSAFASSENVAIEG